MGCVGVCCAVAKEGKKESLFVADVTAIVHTRCPTAGMKLQETKICFSVVTSVCSRFLSVGARRDAVRPATRRRPCDRHRLPTISTPISTNATIMESNDSEHSACVSRLLQRYTKRCHDGGSEPRQPGATRDVGAHCGCEGGHNGEHHFALGQFAKQVRALAALIARCVTCTIHSSVHAHVDVLACHFGARSICAQQRSDTSPLPQQWPLPSIAPTQHVDHSRASCPTHRCSRRSTRKSTTGCVRITS